MSMLVPQLRISRRPRHPSLLFVDGIREYSRRRYSRSRLAVTSASRLSLARRRRRRAWRSAGVIGPFFLRGGRPALFFVSVIPSQSNFVTLTCHENARPCAAPAIGASSAQPFTRLCTVSTMLQLRPASAVVCPSRKPKGQRGDSARFLNRRAYSASLQKGSRHDNRRHHDTDI